MTRAQGFGSLAAIGGLTALIALQTGIPTANADELADLRANQQLLQQRIDQLAQAQAQGIPEQKQSPGFPGAMGSPATPGVAMAGGSFPRSFLIPGTDTSIRVGGFVDITVLDFLQGGGGVNGSNYGSNSGQNGTLFSLPLGGGVVPGAAGGSKVAGGFVGPSINRAPPRNNGIFEMSPQQSRLNVETRTPTAWGESRTFFEMDWSGCDNFSCQTLGQGGGNSLQPRLRYAYGTLGGFLAGQAISNFSDADADTEFDGIRRRHGVDRRHAHPAGALHARRAVRQRLLDIGGKPVHDHSDPGRCRVERLGICRQRQRRPGQPGRPNRPHNL